MAPVQNSYGGSHVHIEDCVRVIAKDVAALRPAPQPKIVKHRLEDCPAQEECPKRFEGGQHRWTEGAPGEPRWCYYCETTEPNPAPAQEEAEDKYLAGRVTLSQVHAAVPKPTHAPETKVKTWVLCGSIPTIMEAHVKFCTLPHLPLVPDSIVAEARKQAVEETLREAVKAMEFREMQLLRSQGYTPKGSIWLREFAREKGIEL